MKRPPLKIGNVVVDPPVVLAPMAGYTDSALRSLCMRFGCGMAFTEVVSAKALIHGSKRTLHLFETAENERPAVGHIYGKSPEEMAEAAVIIEKMGRFDLIDVNAGCPVRKIVAKGCGVALMSDPTKIKAIVSAIHEAVQLPVTIKTRLGLKPENMNIMEVLRAAEEGGASAISVHARFASGKHGGMADWDALARVKSEACIPVIGNGGVDKAADAVEMFSRTGVDGVMVARAAVGNPWFFEEVNCLLEGRDYQAHGLEEHRAVIMAHFEKMVALKEKELLYRRKGSLPADDSAALHFRAHLFKYLSGMQGWGEVRRGLHRMNTAKTVIEAVDFVLSAEAASR